MRKLLPVGVLLLLVGCNPPVDPSATFTIEGTLVRADGAPGAQDTVRIFKIDEWIDREDHVLLDYPSLDEFASQLADDEFTVEADADGAFSVELQGREVNAADGNNAAHLLVTYTDPNNPDLATRSDWHTFEDENPVWSVGDVKLWDGGSGSVSSDGDVVTFDAESGAPSGNTRRSSMPVWVLAYTDDTQSNQSFLEWAAFSVSSASIDVPREAFTGDSAPTFLLFSASQDGSRDFWHRTSLKQVSGSWSFDSLGLPLGPENVTLIDQNGTEFSDDYAQDDNLGSPWHNFAAGDDTFYVDLGQTTLITDVLIYNLVLDPNLRDATITVTASDADVDSPPSNWDIELTAQGPGTRELQNWTYVGWTGSESVRWLRINVDSTTEAERTLESVAEVTILEEPL